MGLTTAWGWNLREASGILATSTALTDHGVYRRRSRRTHNLLSPSLLYPFPHLPNKPCTLRAKKRKPDSEPVLKPSVVEEVSIDDEEEIVDDEEGSYFEDGILAEDAEPYAGDGAGGGGISLAGTSWDKEALAIAEEVLLSFVGELKIYAFRTLANSTIQVRIEKLSNKSGSPSLDDIEAFSSAYRVRLDEAELSGSIPNDISLEVSSPGVERVVRIPEELDRFKHRAMSVKYVTEGATPGSSNENFGVFRLISFDLEENICIWGLADVRVNREKAGKGRSLSKKQREWQLTTPFDSLRLVRLYSEA